MSSARGSAMVTDDMVERAMAVRFDDGPAWRDGLSEDDIAFAQKQMRRCLEAAVSDIVVAVRTAEAPSPTHDAVDVHHYLNLAKALREFPKDRADKHFAEMLENIERHLAYPALPRPMATHAEEALMAGGMSYDEAMAPIDEGALK